MIIHEHDDGSFGYQYEVGDLVIVDRTIHGGWFDIGPTTSKRCIVHKIEKNTEWRVARLEIRWADDWGCVDCYRWHLRPHEETLAAAKRVKADSAPKQHQPSGDDPSP